MCSNNFGPSGNVHAHLQAPGTPFDSIYTGRDAHEFANSTLFPCLAGAILTFVEQNTVHVDGIGDVCSFSAFDLERHGNRRYGSPVEAPKVCGVIWLNLGGGTQQGDHACSFLL